MIARQPTPDILGDLLGGMDRTFVAVDDIRIDGGTQMRAGLNAETVEEYRQWLDDLVARKQNGLLGMPPIILYHDGETYWLADGFHRLAAWKLHGSLPTAVHADVRSGTRRDAVLHAAGANAAHGLRRTNADKRRSVEVMLNDEEWRLWPDAEIARRCMVSQPFVSAMRKDLSYNGYKMPDERTVTRGGQIYTQNTANIGSTRTLASDTPAVQPSNGSPHPNWPSQNMNWQPVTMPVDIAKLGYLVEWKPSDGWRILTADGEVMRGGLNSMSECISLIRNAQRVAPSGKPLLDIFPTYDQQAAIDAERDIAEREAAADEAASQAAEAAPADDKLLVDWDNTDWDAYNARRKADAEEAAHRVAAEHRAKRNGMTKAEYATWLAPQVADWLYSYNDKYGRTLSDIAHGAAHSNSTHWVAITTEFNRRGLYWDDDTLKDAIKEAFEILRVEADEDVGEVVLPANDDSTAEHLKWRVDGKTYLAVGDAYGPDEPIPDEPITVVQSAAIDNILNPMPVSQRDGYDSDEWYTPTEYIEAARAVMGGIDLDPASCELAQTVVKADVYLSKLEDGLSVRWIRERVWLNPPYSDPAAWVTKLLAEVDDKTFVKQVVVLVNNATETAWFQALLARYPVCLPNKRLAFWRHDHEGITSRQGQAVFYLGSNVAQFAKTFGVFGPVLRRMA